MTESEWVHVTNQFKALSSLNIDDSKPIGSNEPFLIQRNAHFSINWLHRINGEVADNTHYIEMSRAVEICFISLKLSSLSIVRNNQKVACIQFHEEFSFLWWIINTCIIGEGNNTTYRNYTNKKTKTNPQRKCVLL